MDERGLFLSANRDRTYDGKQSRFDAIIVYEWRAERETFRAQVVITLQGYRGGRVLLLPNDPDGRLGSLLHLEFSPSYQSFVFDEKHNALLVQGESKKHQGRYTVSITLT